ncbi:MAG: hypothetical protein HQM09_04155 [Candidatus Riflebacteria bacterium]|nr:hypothetical protein [Candidatus Riflebacteria bacterium]
MNYMMHIIRAIVLLVMLGLAPFCVFAQEHSSVIYYEDSINMAFQGRDVLEKELQWNIGAGSPAAGRGTLQNWGLWNFVRDSLKDSGTFDIARQLVINKDEPALQEMVRRMLRGKSLNGSRNESFYGEEDDDEWSPFGYWRKPKILKFFFEFHRETVAAILMAGAMLFFVLPKRTLRKLLGVRHTFRRRPGV